MLDAADRLLPRRVLIAREVEEPQQVVIADVEEEVIRPGVVPVLYQLDQRETEELLVEPDGLLGVFADKGQVVHSAHGADRALRQRPEILLAQFFPPCAYPG